MTREQAQKGEPDLSTETLAQIRTALFETYYKGSWVVDNSSEQAAQEVHEHLRGRFESARRWFLPWLRRFIDLQKASVVEIGCGTGSITAALALDAKAVDAYDISGPSIEAARRRLAIMGLNNVFFHDHSPEELLNQVRSRHQPGSVDCLVLFAVLEHQKPSERIATLRAGWDVLAPGGILVVAEVPSRLAWNDDHTSWLPFFNLLPEEVAIDYADRSPRTEFAAAMRAAKERSVSDAYECLARWGRGVSFHEFKIALGDIEPLIVGDGFEQEPMSHYGVSLETRLLYTYVSRKNLRVPPAFVRDTIDLILRKPGGGYAPAPQRSKEDLDSLIYPLIDP